MQRNRKLTTKDVALTVCFSALYTVFCLLPIFQIVGLPSKSITMAAILAPLIGILVGPYLGVLSTTLGGVIGLFIGPLSPPGFVSGLVAAFSASTLYFGKRNLAALVYFSLLFLFGFYPFVGPVWLYPPLMWFQIIGFLILISPLQSSALKTLNSSTNNNSRLLFAFFITSLTSTLAGQIGGSLTLEVLAWPIFMADVNTWKTIWQITMFLYPVERTIIAAASALIGTSLLKVLKATKTVTHE
ncbi:MAG: hypothetical protein QW386_00565 [Candidatus Bathyarchaeia archaeon]